MLQTVATGISPVKRGKNRSRPQPIRVHAGHQKQDGERKEKTTKPKGKKGSLETLEEQMQINYNEEDRSDAQDNEGNMEIAPERTGEGLPKETNNNEPPGDSVPGDTDTHVEEPIEDNTEKGGYVAPEIPNGDIHPLTLTSSIMSNAIL